MAATYRAVMLMKPGGPERLQIVELPVAPPGPGQLRVRARAAGVGATDLIVLAGKDRYAPKIPLVPGYEVAGVVEAIGDGVTGFEVGQRVAALTVYGGFAELVTREAEHFLPIPDDVSDRDAAAGRRGKFYGITMLYRKDPQQPRADPPKIFSLLGQKKIDPFVNHTFPLLDAGKALELLSAGSVEGKIVLINA